MMRVRAVLLAGVLAGCGPWSAGSLLVEASAELAAAATAEAPDKAPYEYTAAEAYLHKAREDHSYANYETAERFAKKARDCAQLARARAETSTRQELGAKAVEISEDLACRAGATPARNTSAEEDGE